MKPMVGTGPSKVNNKTSLAPEHPAGLECIMHGMAWRVVDLVVWLKQAIDQKAGTVAGRLPMHIVRCSAAVSNATGARVHCRAHLQPMTAAKNGAPRP